MADKGGKRKHFDVPLISDEEEVIEVSPVFNRLRKTKKETTSTKDRTKAPSLAISLEIGKSKQLGKGLDLIPSELLGSLISGETNDIPGFKPVSDKETVKQSELRDKGGKIHAGRNFMETFAFIEKTKHYEEPKVSKIGSCSSSDQAVPQSNTTQDVPPVKTSKPNAIIVNQRQKGNPVLKFFRHVPWEYGDLVPDYVMGPKMCALFLSTRYHNFNPNYIHDRLKQLGSRYELRVLLVQVDTKDPHKTLKELTKIAILADCTLILAWSAEEVARYIETYKIYENKPPESLQGQTSNDYLSKLTDCLTTVKSVNKTDAVTLLTTFGSLENIISASVDEIALCPGFGPQKAKRLHGAFNQPFVASKKVTENNGSTSSKT